jgi:hypothetical protein
MQSCVRWRCRVGKAKRAHPFSFHVASRRGHDRRARSSSVKKAFGNVDIGSTPFATTSIWSGMSTVGTLRFAHPTASSIVDGRGRASPSHRRGKRRVRQKAIFAKHFRLIWAVQSLREKIFAFAVGQITSSFSPVLHSSGGAYASSRTWSAGCDGRWMRCKTSDVFCGRRSRVVLMSRCWHQVLRNVP